jgi:hypothetical protein
MDPKLLGPLLLGAVTLLLMYRRVRRSFGRQSVNTARLSIRATVLGLLGVLLATAVWRDYHLVTALALGIVAGAILALVGLRHTRFETTGQDRFYTPHTYIGVLVLALFVGRLVYRLAVNSTAAPALHGAAGGAPNPLAMYGHNPLTLTIIGLPIGYYVLYNLGVLRKSRALAEHPPGTADL